jgi:protein-tyrosine phosphatase
MPLLQRLFGPSKDLPLPDLSGLAVDMHSHLIPGIDDGVKSKEESLSLLRQFSELGYKKIITTPHVNLRFPNTTAGIMTGLKELQVAMQAAEIPLTVEAAAEYQVEDGFEKLLGNRDFLTFGDHHILLELSYFVPHPDFSEIIYELQTAGYNVILAHAERYGYWHRKFSGLEQLRDRDVALQVNLSSLSGYFSSDVRNAARRLIENGWVSYAGSDVHNQQYMENFIRGSRDKYARQLLESGLLKNHLL